MSKNHLTSITKIESKIYFIRKKKVMFDKDLAVLYGVETKAFNQAVKRNIERFPEDFMFQMTRKEADRYSRSQFVTLNRGRNIKYLPYVFTEQGVAMLSSILKSKTAIQANIQIIRAFVQLRELVVTNGLIRQKIEELEKKYQKHDQKFQIVFDAIRELLETPPAKKKKPVGFHVRYE